MSEKLVANFIEAAGGIVEHGTSQGPLVAVVYRDRDGGKGEWSLPKGDRKVDESWQETAIHRVREKINVTPEIVGIVGANAYFAHGQPKLVLYWRMRTKGALEPLVAKDDVNKLAWLEPARAIERLTHEGEADLVRRAFSQGEKRLDSPITIPAAPWWQRRRWQRLASAVIAYDQELQGRAKLFHRLPEGLATIRGILKEATDALEIRDIDRGWICFHKARQLELLHLDDPQLDAVAMVMQHEAEKLKGWRKKAVLRLLSVDGENQAQKKEEPRRCPKISREQVFCAAQIRDEHYDNEAYKDSLRQSSLLLFAITLAVILVAVLGLSYLQYLPFEPTQAAGPPQSMRLLSVAVFGLLGAITSAIFSSSKGSSLRIPEMVSSFQATTLRLLVGPASAIALYFVARSELSPQAFKSLLSNDYGAATLAIAFAAGFSEQIVRRVVESFTGES